MKSTPVTRRGYGWIPDLPDQRGYLYASLHRRPATFPSAVDPRPGCSAIDDQGSFGSCTGNALVGALEFLDRKDNERVIEHTTNTDSGAMVRDGIKTLAKQGVCT